MALTYNQYQQFNAIKFSNTALTIRSDGQYNYSFLSDSYTPDYANHVQRSDISAYEVATGGLSGFNDALLRDACIEIPTDAVTGTATFTWKYFVLRWGFDQWVHPTLGFIDEPLWCCWESDTPIVEAAEQNWIVFPNTIDGYTDTAIDFN